MKDMNSVTLCYQSHVSLLERSGRPSDGIALLESGIKKLEKAQRELSPDAFLGDLKRVALRDGVSGLKQYLGRRYLESGRRDAVLALAESELRIRPVRTAQAHMMVLLLRSMGLTQDALRVARMAEFASWGKHSGSPAMIEIVNARLVEAGLDGELTDRLETQRNLGVELNEPEYELLASRYSGTRAIDTIKKGIAKHPQSYVLHAIHMKLLAASGHKDAAYKAYETSRDLFLEKLTRPQVSQAPGFIGVRFRREAPSWRLGATAATWFHFLLQEGKIRESESLENRVRDACAIAVVNADELVFARAQAEVAVGKHSDAVKSLRKCLELNQGNKAWVVAALASSLDASNQQEESLKWYPQAIQLNDYDPAWVSRHLVLTLQHCGVRALISELQVYQPLSNRLNVRLNATLSGFDAWVRIATGNKHEATYPVTLAGVYMLLAQKQGGFTAVQEDQIVCAAILHNVWEALGNQERMAQASQVLKLCPPEKVQAMKDLFSFARWR